MFKKNSLGAKFFKSSSISKSIAFFINLFLIIKTLHIKKINNINIKNVVSIKSTLNTPFYTKINIFFY